jgi:hypothetical protein
MPIGLRTECPVAGLANLTDPYPVRGLAMCRRNALVYQGSLRLASLLAPASFVVFLPDKVEKMLA